MITFEGGLDDRCKEVRKPSVACLMVEGQQKFCVIGIPDEDYLRDAGGEVKLWNHYGSADKAMRSFCRRDAIAYQIKHLSA